MDDSPLIVVDKSIGDIVIGMPQAAVIARYGKPAKTVAMTALPGHVGEFAVYKPAKGFLYVYYEDKLVVGVQTDADRYRTSLSLGRWGPGTLFSQVHLPGSKPDQCSGGLWDGPTKAVLTIAQRAGPLVASVWITRLEYYDLCVGNPGGEVIPPTNTGTTETTTTATFTLNVSAQPVGTGFVDSSPGGMSCPPNCSATYPAGTTVTLVAHPGQGFGFDHWTGDCSGTAPTCTVTITSDLSATAIFNGSGPQSTEPNTTNTTTNGQPPPPPPTTGGG